MIVRNSLCLLDLIFFFVGFLVFLLLLFKETVMTLLRQVRCYLKLSKDITVESTLHWASSPS